MDRYIVKKLYYLKHTYKYESKIKALFNIQKAPIPLLYWSYLSKFETLAHIWRRKINTKFQSRTSRVKTTKYTYL
jgi:hypothetical protein